MGLFEEISNRLDELEKLLNKEGGNPYHDKLGRFTTSRGTVKKKAGVDGGYLEEAIDSLDEEQLKSLVKEPLADLSQERLEEIHGVRRNMYSSEKDFALANQWLRSVIGSGGNISEKARDIGFDPQKEIELSKKMLKGGITLYRNQPVPFDKQGYGQSRWVDIPGAYSNQGKRFRTVITKENLLVHPEVLYSADLGEKHYRQEREYVLKNEGLVVEEV